MLYRKKNTIQSKILLHWHCVPQSECISFINTYTGLHNQNTYSEAATYRLSFGTNVITLLQISNQKCCHALYFRMVVDNWKLNDLGAAFEIKRVLGSNTRESCSGPVTFLGYGPAWPVRIKRYWWLFIGFIGSSTSNKARTLKWNQWRPFKYQRQGSRGPLDFLPYFNPCQGVYSAPRFTS